MIIRNAIWFMLLAPICIMGQAQIQEPSLSPGKKGKVGLSVALVRTAFVYRTNPYVLVDSTQEMGNSDIQNAIGVAGGITYRHPLSDLWSFRAGFDGVVTSPFIQFDTKVNYRERSIIYPLTIELPLMMLRKFSNQETHHHEFGLGIRPAMAIPSGQPAFPKLKQYFVCIDASYGLALQRPKSVMRCEVFASICPLNLIADGSDYKTQSITMIQRNMLGLRLIFD